MRFLLPDAWVPHPITYERKGTHTTDGCWMGVERVMMYAYIRVIVHLESIISSRGMIIP